MRYLRKKSINEVFFNPFRQFYPVHVIKYLTKKSINKVLFFNLTKIKYNTLIKVCFFNTAFCSK